MGCGCGRALEPTQQAFGDSQLTAPCSSPGSSQGGRDPLLLSLPTASARPKQDIKCKTPILLVAVFEFLYPCRGRAVTQQQAEPKWHSELEQLGLHYCHSQWTQVLYLSSIPFVINDDCLVGVRPHLGSWRPT